MKNQSLKSKFLLLTLFSILLFSCAKDPLVPDEKENDTKPDLTALKAGNMDLPGRTLAANCFQCHGTNGYAGELKISGQGASEIISKFNEFKAKDPRSNIMNVHAHGYTDEQIKLIADYISKQ